jgi:hypothetical protein
MAQYRKKPVVIEAVKWTGNNSEIEHMKYIWGQDFILSAINHEDYFGIATLEGVMNISLGDFIIKGVQGEFYPCKPDIFELTYEVVE